VAHSLEFYEVNKFTNKPIIINIQGQSNDNVFFNSIILSNAEVVNCIKELDIKFWVGELSKENEYNYKSIFGVPIKYPFVAIVGNIGNNFTVIEFINDLHAKNEFISKVTSASDHLKNESLKKKREHEAREKERKEREEQNKLFQQSQREDKLKDIQKQEDAEMALVTAASKLSTLHDFRQTALSNYDKLPPEPDAKSIPKPVRIVITLPDGTKKQRNFQQNDKLELLFTWVCGLIAQRLTDETYLDDKSPPLNGSEAIIPWTISSYVLVASFPKRSFTMFDSKSTLLEVGLAPQGGVLILQKIG